MSERVGTDTVLLLSRLIQKLTVTLWVGWLLSFTW